MCGRDREFICSHSSRGSAHSIIIIIVTHRPYIVNEGGLRDYAINTQPSLQNNDGHDSARILRGCRWGGKYGVSKAVGLIAGAVCLTDS